MITLDGSFGEGGGQILRTSLALSLCTGRPIRIDRIRAGRRKPGLLRQHLTCVRAAATIGHAEVEGAALGSSSLTFRPRYIEAGTHAFAVGTAGSANLVLQAVLPALLVADGPSTITIEGGTHNPSSPSTDYLQRVFAPVLQRMGVDVAITLDRYGFYPAGGGQLTARITPGPLAPLSLLHRGETRGVDATVITSALPAHIGRRETTVLKEELDLPWQRVHRVTVEDPRGPGNALFVEVRSADVTEAFVGFGEKGKRAETVARRIATQAQRYLADDVPVGEHLADQLLIPLALAGGGAFRTRAPSRHATTNAAVIERFLPVAFVFETLGDGSVRVGVERR